MAPRNNDSNANYSKKKTNFPVENDDVEMKDIVPSLLHKKHKVVKLVKSQIQKVHEEGLFCNIESLRHDAEFIFVNEKENPSLGNKSGVNNGPGGLRRGSGGEEEDMNRGNQKGFFDLCLNLLWLILAFLLLVFVAVWVSTGPLSNSMAHTPIPPSSFVRTDGLCSLEKKYLLRWSKPEYFE